MANLRKKSRKVSIIIPCFNQGRYLKDSIGSIISTTHTDWEIIIVNDGSTDQETLRELTAVQNKYDGTDKIKIVNQKNQGLSEARNQGILHSKGAYIQLLDADDLITPEKIETQLNLFEKNPGVDVIVSDYYFAPEDLGHLKEVTPSTISEYDFSTRSFLKHWEQGFSVPIHCALFKRDLFEKIQFMPQLKGKEDWVFWTTLSFKISSSNILYHPDRMAIYRVNNGSMTKDPEKMLIEWIKAQTYLFSKFSELFSEEDLFDAIDRRANHIKKSYLQKITYKEHLLYALTKKTLKRWPRIYLIACRIFDFLKKIKNKLDANSKR